MSELKDQTELIKNLVQDEDQEKLEKKIKTTSQGEINLLKKQEEVQQIQQKVIEQNNKDSENNSEKELEEEEEEQEDSDLIEVEGEGGNKREIQLAFKEKILEEKALKRLCLTKLQKFDKDKDVLNFINRFHPDQGAQFQVIRIFKGKNSYNALVEFATQEQKELFENQFRDPKNAQKTKKVRLSPKDKYELDKIKKGRPIAVIKEFQQKIATLKVATKEQIEEQKKIPITEKVVPLINTPYNEQIEIKRNDFEKVLKNWSKSALKAGGGILKLCPQWVGDSLPIEITGVIECPEDERLRYRNKMDLTVGKDLDGNIVVGMNKGSQFDGTLSVERADTITVLTEEGLLIGKLLEEHAIKRSDILLPFNKFTGEGFYKQISIRQSLKTKQIMITIAIQVSKVSQDIVEEEKQNYLKMFVTEQSEELSSLLKKNGNHISSLNVSLSTYAGEGNEAADELVSLFGQPFYQEEILGKRFNVAPYAFLQNHTGQTDRLYSLIGDLIKSDINGEKIFLDICSGLGTIGMCLAEKSKQVIGIEMNKEACEAAQENAKLNNINNYKVVCAKIEDVINDIIQDLKKDNPDLKVVAVVDPPRPGLHKSVVSALRKCELIDNLVYVACSPSSILDNLNYLCLQNEGKRKGIAFNPIKSYVVDLFPMTHHYEGVFFLSREIKQQETNNQQQNDNNEEKQ